MYPPRNGPASMEWKMPSSSLNSPIRIQEYLDGIGYNTGKETRSPKLVMEHKSAHCFEGALLAAACLRGTGHPPLIVDLRAVNDDDHVIAVYRKGRCWGAIAKSNFTTLRFREPVYRSIRELAMSYFDLYFNTSGEKTLREYSNPLDLSLFDRMNWMTTNEDLGHIGDLLDRTRHHGLIDRDQEEGLSRVGSYLIKAGMLGSDPDGLYKPV